jgi:hypothetical protein
VTFRLNFPHDTKSFLPQIPIHTIAISKSCSACCVTTERARMTKKPHENTRLAKYVERRVLELKRTKSQAEMAAQAG